LDGRNSDSRDLTVYELIAARWNSDTFDPVVPASDVHEDFLDATDCRHALVAHMTPATATKIKDLIAQMRSDLTRMIQHWEQGGQGDGGSLDEGTTNDDFDDDVAINPEFGALAGRTALALENRAAFLKHLPPYLLIFWEMADRHQILYSALDRLDSAVGAANVSSAPSVIRNNWSSPSLSLGRTLTGGEGEGFTDAIYHFAGVVKREQQANQAAEQASQKEMVHQQQLNQVKDLHCKEAVITCTLKNEHKLLSAAVCAILAMHSQRL
jgi:hypothetical protein